MDTNEWVNIISNFGFPIGVNIFLIYILYQIFNKFVDEFNDMKTSIQMNTKELEELRQTLKGMNANEKV